MKGANQTKATIWQGSARKKISALSGGPFESEIPENFENNGRRYCKADDGALQEKAGKKDSQGIFQYAAPFKFIEAVEYLTLQPKFGGDFVKNQAEVYLVNGSDDSSRRAVEAGDRRHQLVGSGNDIIASTTSQQIKRAIPGLVCQVEIERAKRDGGLQDRSAKIEITLTDLSNKLDIGKEVLHAIEKRNENAADADNDYCLLQMLYKYYQEFREIMSDMLKESKVRM
ncbi:unnamed protein product [Agarophyton chilense]